MPDPLARLAELPGVAAAVETARREVDDVLWDRAVRARMAEVVAESRLQGAWASACLDGAELPAAAVRDGSAADDSPMGRVLEAAIRVQAELPQLVGVLERAPAQVWARLHAVAARGQVPDDELGRPRAGLEVADPLLLGPAPPVPEVIARLDALGRLLVVPTQAPAVVVAAVVQGELLALRPFRWGSALLARAGFRLVLMARGADPDGATVPETGLLGLGRPAYRAAVLRYRQGSADAMAEWIATCARAVSAGARAAVPDPRAAPGGAPLRGTSPE